MNSRPVYRSKTLQEIVSNQAKRIRELEAKLKEKPAIKITPDHIHHDPIGEAMVYLDDLKAYVDLVGR